MTGDTLRYVLVYDAVAAGYPDWWVPALGVGIVLAACVTIYGVRRWGWEARGRASLYLAVPFGLFLTTLTGTITYGDYAAMRDAMRAGRYTVVEGTVENFHPSDPGDHSEERWTVTSGGRVYRYAYAPSRMAPGFRQTAVRGGPVRPGLRVRIADVNGRIGRLEIAR